MKFLHKLRQFIGLDLKETWNRFALPVVLTFIVTVIALFAVHFPLSSSGGEKLHQLMAMVVAGWFASLAIYLYGEGRCWDVQRSFGFALIAFGVLFGIFAATENFWMCYVFVFPALVISVSFAPFIGRTVEGDVDCYFNANLSSSVFFAVISSMILAGGLCIVMASLQYLFDVRISGKRYADVLVLASCLFAPLYVLSHTPRIGEEEASISPYPKGIGFIVRYISAPLVLVYTAILYAYGGKILFVGELPKGQLVYMIVGYGMVGIATQLFSRPLVAQGDLMPGLVSRFFYKMLWFPVVLLWVAIGIRIADYGMTEPRYAAVIVGIWLGFAAIYMSVSAAKSMRVVLASFVVLLLLASVGPWGAQQLSTVSQKARLHHVLERNQLLVDGKLRAAASEEAVSFEDIKQISSLLEYFYKMKKEDALREWFPLVRRAHNTVNMVMKGELNLTYVNRWERERRQKRLQQPQKETSKSFKVNVKGTRGYGGFLHTDVRRFDAVLSAQNIAISQSTKPIAVADKTWLSFDRNQIIVTRRAKDGTASSIVTFELGALFLDLYEERRSLLAGKEKLRLMLERENDQLLVRLELSHMAGSVKKMEPHVRSVSMQLLVHEKGASVAAGK